MYLGSFVRHSWVWECREFVMYTDNKVSGCLVDPHSGSLKSYYLLFVNSKKLLNEMRKCYDREWLVLSLRVWMLLLLDINFPSLQNIKMMWLCLLNIIYLLSGGKEPCIHDLHANYLFMAPFCNVGFIKLTRDFREVMCQIDTQSLMSEIGAPQLMDQNRN